jgi:hypothetical protein
MGRKCNFVSSIDDIDDFGSTEGGDDYCGIEHLSLGQRLDVYGRFVTLVRCDAFTIEFLKSCGLNVGVANATEFDQLMAGDGTKTEV